MRIFFKPWKGIAPRGEAFYASGWSGLQTRAAEVPPWDEGSKAAGRLMQPYTIALPLVWRLKVTGQSLEMRVLLHTDRSEQDHT